jgi:hypothetical protein
MSGFAPKSLTARETGPAEPFTWRVNGGLTYTDGHATAHAAEAGFETDLASVPLIMTWLFPRYGLYTKAAVVHDKLCRPDSPIDRFDADEIFNEMMVALGVPGLRRLLMVGAVTWPTMIGHLVKTRVGAVAVVVFSILSTLLLAEIWSGWRLVLAAVVTFLLWIGIVTGITAPVSRWRSVARCLAGTIVGSLFIVPALALLAFVGLYRFLEGPREAMWKVADSAILAMKVLDRMVPGQDQPGIVVSQPRSLSTPRQERIRALFGLD